jgi:hypothetical protein
MKRLRLELKQTMDMYNSACKEAVAARHRVRSYYNFNYIKHFFFSYDDVLGVLHCKANLEERFCIYADKRTSTMEDRRRT